MLNAIGYARVSTKKQGDNGISRDAQVATIRQLAKDKGLRIRKIYREARTAQGEENGTQRPEFDAAVAQALKHDWPIIVDTMTRFTRTPEIHSRP